MRWLALFAAVVLFAPGARAQARDSANQSLPPVASKLDLESATLPSVRALPTLKPSKSNESVFSGLDLGGSTLNFEGDRKPPDNRIGAELFEPGTVMSRKSPRAGPTFFGLSIKKPIE